MNILIPGVIGTIKINWATNAAIWDYLINGQSCLQRFPGILPGLSFDGDSTGAYFFSQNGTLQRKREIPLPITGSFSMESFLAGQSLTRLLFTVTIQ